MSARAAERAARGPLEPLTPQRKWRAITFATALLAPAVWSLLAGWVAVASDEPGGPSDSAAALAIAFGLCTIPFVFVVLAFASEHPRAPGAVVRAMLLSVPVGVVASVMAGDAVTGIVAGMGAGGVVALRADAGHTTGLRTVGVVVAAVYSFTLVRVAGPIALVAAPIFPFTALGLADHYGEWRAARAGAGQPVSGGR